MENTRSYAKESFKSKPSGIRFNLDQEKIALMRSGKKTRQQLVDFLLENYVKGENPVLDRSESLREKKQVVIAEVDLLDSYLQEISDSTGVEQIEKIVKASKNDSGLSGIEKLQVQEAGKEKSKTVDF